MSKWFLIDDCTTAKGATFEEPMAATTREEAAEELRRAWDRLSRADQKARDDFRAVLAEADEDGIIDYETVTDEVTREEV